MSHPHRPHFHSSPLSTRCGGRGLVVRSLQRGVFVCLLLTRICTPLTPPPPLNPQTNKQHLNSTQVYRGGLQPCKQHHHLQSVVPGRTLKAAAREAAAVPAAKCGRQCSSRRGRHHCWRAAGTYLGVLGVSCVGFNTVCLMRCLSLCFDGSLFVVLCCAVLLVLCELLLLCCCPRITNAQPMLCLLFAVCCVCHSSILSRCFCPSRSLHNYTPTPTHLPHKQTKHNQHRLVRCGWLVRVARSYKTSSGLTPGV